MVKNNFNRLLLYFLLKLNSKPAGMTRFRDVIEFVLFVASILKMRFTFCLIVQYIHHLETTFFIK